MENIADLGRAMGSSETARDCWRLLLSEGSLEPTLRRADSEGFWWRPFLLLVDTLLLNFCLEGSAENPG